MATFGTNHNAQHNRAEDRLLATLAAVGGTITLALTWYFHQVFFTAAHFTWLGLVQPALLFAGGGLALVAATMLLTGQPTGRETLKLAAAFLPFVLAWRLLVLVGRVGWETISWALSYAQGQTTIAPFEGVRLTPFNILNIVVILIIIAANVVRWRRARRK